MRPTERFNRLSSIFAAEYDINRQLKRLQRYNPGDKQYEKAVNRLKWYELTDREIKLFGKYKNAEGVYDLKGFDKFKMQRRMDVLRNKMNHAAHVKTQGSTADMFMPKWAGKRGLKPLTLFKRMAFAATSNTIKNTKHSVKNGHIFRPLVGLLATYISGQTMIGIYRNLLGTEMPNENSDWWVRFKTILWKGEFLGVLSEFFTPYKDRMMTSMHPALYDSALSIVQSAIQLSEGKVNKGQALNEILKSNVSAYNNIQKIRQRTMNSFYRDKLKFGQYYSEFEDKVLGKIDVERENTTRTPYYKDLEYSFYHDTKEEYSKQLAATFIAVAHDLYRNNRAETVEEAFKLSWTQMKNKFKYFNPNRAKAGIKHSGKFFKWLSKNPNYKDLAVNLLKLEQEYKDRIKLYNGAVPGVWKKLNLKDLVSYYDWNQKDF